MKANRSARSFARDDQAVSPVVAAVLLFGLFVTVTTIWTFQTLPQWIADNEERHMQLVKERFDTLKAGLDAGSGAGSTAPVSAAFPLAAEKVALLQPVATTGTLAIVSNLEAAIVFDADPQIYISGGSPSLTPTAFTSGEATSDVRDLTGAVLGLTSVGVSAANTAFAQMAANDGTLTVTARLSHATASSANCGASTNFVLLLDVTTTTGSSTTASTPLLCTGTNNAISDYRVDLLATPAIAGPLSRLAAPFTVTFTSSGTGTAPTRALVWTDDSSGADRTLGSGLSQAFAVDVAGEALQFTSLNQHYPAQTLSLELGGIVRAQGDGQAMATSPSFEVAADGGEGALRWTLLDLDAPDGASSTSGEGQATAIVTPVASNEVLLRATGGTVTLRTEQAEGWRSFLASQLQLAGITGCAPAVVAGSPDTLTWDFGGCSSGGSAVTTWVLHLNLVEAHVRLT